MRRATESAAPDEGGVRRILAVNVNTTEAMTRLIAEQAQAPALPGTTIIPATPAFGPASVESILQSHLSAVGVDGVPAVFMVLGLSHSLPFQLL